MQVLGNKHLKLTIALSVLVLLCLVGLLSAIPASARQEGLYNKFAGTYVTGHDFGGGSLTLDAGGRFSEGAGSDDGTKISTSGTYTLSDGRLNFTIVKHTGNRGRELNLLDPKDRKEMFGDSGGEKIEKEFEMLPIEWSGRIYLLYETDLKNFADAVNLGIEPRTTLTSNRYSSPWYGSFYLRSGDEQKKVAGNPRLPEQWLSYLLNKPVTAKVIRIEEIKKFQLTTTFTATINKGSREGLKVGMRLLTEGEIPSPWDGTEVISVAEKTARIRTNLVRSELKVGDKINSRYNPKDLL